MRKHIIRLGLIGIWLGGLLAVGGCDQTHSTSSAVLAKAVAIESADECHLCGMIIHHHPGPKGELYESDSPEVRKFCSTRDLLAYALDPERAHRLSAIYVHDMSKVPWGQPDDDYFIDARQAYFVAGASHRGAMGPTLASFASQPMAEAFAKQYGGELYRFEQLTLELINQLGSGH